MERLSERLTAMEAVLKVGTGGRSVGACGFAGKYHLHDQEGLPLSRGVHVYRRVQVCCTNSHRTKSCTTSLAAKMLYFAKEELDAWLLQNYEPTVDDAMRMATEVSATQPFFNQKRYGKRKKN